jgi:peptide/nickel transport system ATP-binding protein
LTARESSSNPISAKPGDHPLLSVRHLGSDFIMPGKSGKGRVAHALEDVSFEVNSRRTLGLVGESGCGKTTALMSILRLLPANGRIISGEIVFDGVDLLSLSERQMRHYRWREIAIIFQGAMNALNPVMRVADQVREAILLHKLMDSHAANERVHELLELVGIPNSRGNQYPHQFSGGMRQRAMIAMALACKPRLLFADEPTTALDVMIQAQALELLKKIQEELGLAIVLVTHDLGVVAEMCDTVVVMYGGKVAEYGSSDDVYNTPQHPYTQRLLQAFPDLFRATGVLASIPGSPPRLTELPPGCRFEPRCHQRIAICTQSAPSLVNVAQPSNENPHWVACHLCIGGSIQTTFEGQLM